MSTSGIVLELTLRRSDAPTPPTGSDLFSGLILTARTRTSQGLSCAAAKDEAVMAPASANSIAIFFMIISPRFDGTHFINSREMRCPKKGCWQGVRRVAWRCHAQGVQHGQRPFLGQPLGNVLFGCVAALRRLPREPPLAARRALHYLPNRIVRTRGYL